MEKIVPLIVVLCITGLAMFAISRGYDGVLLAGVVAVLAGIGGYVAPHKKPPIK